MTSPGIFGPHRRPSDTKRGPRRASPPAALRLRPPAVSTSSSLRKRTWTVLHEEALLPVHVVVDTLRQWAEEMRPSYAEQVKVALTFNGARLMYGLDLADFTEPELEAFGGLRQDSCPVINRLVDDRVLPEPNSFRSSSFYKIEIFKYDLF